MEDADPQTALLCQCLQKQLDEFDMISSIFCGPGELHVDDYSVAADFNEYLAKPSASTQLSSHLDYRICLQNPATEKVEVHVELPHFYPALERPIVVVRAGCFTTAQEIEIKRQIADFIDSDAVDKEEPYVYTIVTWIQDNLERFLSVRGPDEVSDDKKPSARVTFERLWIYSHHIKSKTKRQTLIRTARDLDLTGFSKPGKPGVICVEGLADHTQEFWKSIRAMKWQKIRIRLVEQRQKSVEELSKFRRFADFREEIFTAQDDADSGADSGDETNEAQMDTKGFAKYLQKYNSLYVHKTLFGFE